jgi:LytR cell envelope-related transcriptional attenuator
VRPGRHAADDGSFARSARAAMIRGAALIFAAVLLGIVILRSTDAPDSLAEGEPVATGATAPDTSATTAPPTSQEESTTSSPPPSFDPGSVRVLVANGSSVPGAAGRLSATIGEDGYSLAPAADAPEDVDRSIVYYGEGYEEAANAIASSLSPSPAVEALPDPPPVAPGDLGGANVVVVIAADVAEGA